VSASVSKLESVSKSGEVLEGAYLKNQHLEKCANARMRECVEWSGENAGMVSGGSARMREFGNAEIVAA
jgi:hypothetical protein